jgi:hypothetical protein
LAKALREDRPLPRITTCCTYPAVSRRNIATGRGLGLKRPVLGFASGPRKMAEFEASMNIHVWKILNILQQYPSLSFRQFFVHLGLSENSVYSQ